MLVYGLVSYCWFIVSCRIMQHLRVIPVCEVSTEKEDCSNVGGDALRVMLPRVFAIYALSCCTVISSLSDLASSSFIHHSTRLVSSLFLSPPPPCFAFSVRKLALLTSIEAERGRRNSAVNVIQQKRLISRWFLFPW